MMVSERRCAKRPAAACCERSYFCQVMHPSAHLLQAVGNLTASLTARGIGVVTSEGAPLHIKATKTKDLFGVASKSYLDWYMLTQAWRAATFSVLDPDCVITRQSTFVRSCHDTAIVHAATLTFHRSRSAEDHIELYITCVLARGCCRWCICRHRSWPM